MNTSGNIRMIRCKVKKLKSGPSWDRTSGQTVMHPTTVFTAPFGFVGWTVHSPRRVPAVQSLHLPDRMINQAWLGITISYEEGFPEFDRYHLKITLQAALL
jgi:hypothetical protein